MALQTSGTITMHDVKTELGYSTATELLLNVRNFNGKIQTFIDGAWRDINQCSTIKPTTNAPHLVTDWYGYDNSELCCVPPYNVTIKPYNTGYPVVTDFQVAADTGVGFHLEFQGSTEDLVIVWETASAGGFGGPDSGQGTSVAGVYFGTIDSNSPNLVKCTVTNKCGIASSQIIRVTNTGTTAGSCTPPSSAVLTNNGSTGQVVISSGTTQQIQFNIAHNATGTVSVEVQGDKIDGYFVTGNTSVNATFTVPSGQQGWIKVVISTPCGSKTSNTIQVLPSGSTGGGGGGGNTQYGNTFQSYTVTKSCPSGQTGSQHTKTVQSNTFFADSTSEANTLALNQAISQANAEANSFGTCTDPNVCLGQVTDISISFNTTTVDLNQVLYGSLNITVSGNFTAEIIVGTENGITGTWTLFNDSAAPGEAKNVKTVNLINGLNTFSFGVSFSTAFSGKFTASVAGINIGNCTIDYWYHLGTTTISVNNTCNPNNWSNIGSQFCNGFTLMQGQQNECGDFRDNTIQLLSQHCGFFVATIDCESTMYNVNENPHSISCIITSNISPYNATYQMGYTYITGGIYTINFTSSGSTAVVIIPNRPPGVYSDSYDGTYMFWCDVTVNGTTRRFSKTVNIYGN